MQGRIRRAVAVVTLGLLVLAGCATFPESGPREWRDKIEGSGELGGPPDMPGPEPRAPQSRSPQPSGVPAPAIGCEDPDPQVVETCLEPIGAIAVLPDAQSALVAERNTGRVLLVRRGTEPQLVATVPVDTTGGGGLTGLVLSPGYAEDRLVYAYATTREDNRVVRLAPGEPPKPVLTGIPRGTVNNAGALAVDRSQALLVATGDAGRDPAAPGSLAGKLLRIDTLGRPAPGNPDPASPIVSSGLRQPSGVCVDADDGTVWVTDRAETRDVLHRITPGPLGPPAWTWPERPGVAGCVVRPGTVMVALAVTGALFALNVGEGGGFTGDPQTLLAGTYGRLAATALASDGLLWLGTVNKAGGNPVPSDDRVIRIQPPATGGGEDRS